MPLPTKKPNEDKNTFISRCMSSEVMKREFPNTKQRIAVCYSQFRGKEKKQQEARLKVLSKK